MNEKVTEDDTIVSHNVIGSGKQYVHQDTQNTKENDIQNTNDDNNNTKRRIKSPSPVRKVREHYSPYVERKKGKVDHSGGLQIKIGAMASKQKQNTKKIRYDHNGVEINSKNKRKVKLTFIDKISSQPLIEIVDIDNYKEFNKIAFENIESLLNEWKKKYKANSPKLFTNSSNAFKCNNINDVLESLKTFPIESKSPIECLLFLSDLKKKIINN